MFRDDGAFFAPSRLRVRLFPDGASLVQATLAALAMTPVLLFALLFSPVVQAVEIPHAAYTHKRLLVQQSRLVWGVDAPTATFAAQIHQESLWRENAVSRVGAAGLAQFMPKTGDWIVTVYRDLGEHQPFNPAWALRAMAQYNHHLHARVSGADGCERWAKTLSAYNGGLTWIGRDEKLAASEGYDPARWFDNVELVNSGRSAANFKENRGYPRRILLTLESVYIEAGFGGGVCVDFGKEPVVAAEEEVKRGWFRSLWDRVRSWLRGGGDA